ncbi:uncharacterized protein LOC135492402 [Lineus longissimus]|uniref:uncharacterized protein LOC135492402 n=1 Tax=Lineus longissimus TaxID=88925 RepID=UPI002B4E60BD
MSKMLAGKIVRDFHRRCPVRMCQLRRQGEETTLAFPKTQGFHTTSGLTDKDDAKTLKLKPDLPDYNTDVNVHIHKLKRPTKPPPSWIGLKDLEARTKGSLVVSTLKEMEDNEDFKITAANLRKFGQRKLTLQEKKKRQRALDNLGMPDFVDFWNQKKQELRKQDHELIPVKTSIEVLQLNIGLYCNQACNHCHVESSPKRKEIMNHETAMKCLDIAAGSSSVHTVDITGGAPELCTEFRFLAKEAAALGKKVIDRCNLTALLEPGQEDLADFLAKHQIHVIASLPCYTKKNVNLQRGIGTFDKSIQALLTLNSLGYGLPGTGLELDLVYNPLGAFLPPPQKELEEKYKEELAETFGIKFNKLFTITNMPIKRFADFLYNRHELDDYMHLLIRNYNIATMDNLMCRNTLNVNWDGKFYDCDFNQQLMLTMKGDAGNELSVFDIEKCDDLHGRMIQNDNHCFGCTAGMGSS